MVSLFEATLGQVPSGTCETFCQDLTLAPNGGCEVKFSIREGRRFRGAGDRASLPTLEDHAVGLMNSAG